MHDEPRSPKLSAFEQALAGLTPAAHFDRDGLLFAAGRAAAERDAAQAQRSWRRRAWPLATAALALVSVGLSAALAVRTPHTQIVYIERPALPDPPLVARATTPAPIAVRPTARASASFSPDSYASLRERALRGTFDQRPAREPSASPHEISSPPAEPQTYRALRDALLGVAG